MKERVILEPNLYDYAFSRMKTTFELTLLFLGQEGSFSLVYKLFNDEKRLASTAVEINAGKFHYLRKNFGDDDDLFELKIENKEKKRRYTSEKHRKRFQSPKIFT